MAAQGLASQSLRIHSDAAPAAAEIRTESTSQERTEAPTVSAAQDWLPRQYAASLSTKQLQLLGKQRAEFLVQAQALRNSLEVRVSGSWARNRTIGS